ncbi:MAG: FkbM family methyltransferase [Terriglobales bacterium]
MNRAEGDVDKVVRARFFPQQRSGVFVDVGAARPDFLSISALYRDLGWTVIAIEPNPEFCKLHRNSGHEVLEYACGDHDEDDVSFSVIDSHGAEYGTDTPGKISYEAYSSLAIKPGYADLDPSAALDVKKIKVNLRRLDTILAKHAPGIERIDILSVDVEGWETEVLDGLDFARYRPRVLIIENLFNDAKYWSYMRQKGYALWRNLPPNDVYTCQQLTLAERCRAWLRLAVMRAPAPLKRAIYAVRNRAPKP